MCWGSEIGLPREETLGDVSLNNLEGAGSFQTGEIALSKMLVAWAWFPEE